MHTHLEELKSAESRIPEVFYDPVRFRSWCMERESGYRDHVVDAKKAEILQDAENDGYRIVAGGSEYHLNSQELAKVDRLTGFQRIKKEIQQRSRARMLLDQEEIQESIDTERQHHLSKSPKKLRFLLFNGDQKPLSITEAGKRALLPTQVAMWLSIFCHRNELHVGSFDRASEFKTGDIFTRQINLKLSPPELRNWEGAGRMDPVDFSVGLQYNPAHRDSIAATSEIHRLVCENLTLLNERTAHAYIPQSHDLGAARSRIERFLDQGITDIRETSDGFKHFALSGNSQSSEAFAIWLNRQSLNSQLRSLVLDEVNAIGERTTAYDVFNAITYARNRMDPSAASVGDSEKLSRLAGDYFKDVMLLEGKEDSVLS